MREEENVGIAFEIEKEGDPPSGDGNKLANEVSRRAFRVPVSDSDGLKVGVDGIQYDVVNLGDRGIAFRLVGGESGFAVDDILPSIELRFSNQVLNLRGKVIHISSGRNGGLICGLHFVDMNEETAHGVLRIYKHLRKQLFSNT